MVATNDKVSFDLNADFGDSNYKSCFARSVVVNSQFQSKSLDFRQLQKVNKSEDKRNNCIDGEVSCPALNDVCRQRKESPPNPTLPPSPAPPPNPVLPPPSPPHEDLVRRVSCSSSSGATSSSRLSRRGSEFSVEQIQLHTHIDTLQWQLKQAEASRQMYRAVLQQVTTFLERAHRSLTALGERQQHHNGVQRSRSEFHVAQTENANTPETSADNSAAFRDYTWRRTKRQPSSPDEIPPEKLSSEAFRLLRTAQSLLNTREPDLAHMTFEFTAKDQEFLSQLAREFPSRPQRTTSFSINPQLLSPTDREIRISTAFNRKLSLQRTPNEKRRESIKPEAKKLESGSDYCLMTNNISLNDDSESKRSSVASTGKKNSEKIFFESVLVNDKPPSPKTGSVSSAEDESGFSSMNSFQDVGLPLLNSTVNEQEGDMSVNSSDSNITVLNNNEKTLDKTNILWNRSDLGLPIAHRRWSSTPVEVQQHDPLKVLWV